MYVEIIIGKKGKKGFQSLTQTFHFVLIRLALSCECQAVISWSIESVKLGEKNMLSRLSARP